MKFYVVLVNGSVATVAHLSDEDAVGLIARANELDGMFRVNVVDSIEVTTKLHEAIYEMENEVESWKL